MDLYVCVGVSGAFASIVACRSICGLRWCAVGIVGCFFCFRCLWLSPIVCIAYWLDAVNSVVLCTLCLCVCFDVWVVGFPGEHV